MIFSRTRLAGTLAPPADEFSVQRNGAVEFLRGFGGVGVRVGKRRGVCDQGDPVVGA